jgi:predicted ATPase with chaperone activity
MLVRFFSYAILGFDGILLEFKVGTSSDLPKTIIAGLSDAAVQEDAERKPSAIKNSGLYFPGKHITFDYALPSVRKYCPPSEEAGLPKNAKSQLKLAARACQCTLNQALMIADLAAEPVIWTAHLAKAPRHSTRLEVIV